MGKLQRRISFWLHRGRFERELAEEMEAHRDAMPPDRQRSFGSAAKLREESRETWSWIWLDQLWQDLNYAIRVLAHAPGFALGAVAVLALGVGVNLAEFQIFDAFFHRITIPDVESVLGLSTVSKQGSGLGFSFGTAEFFRAGSRSLAWLASEDTTLDVIADGEADVRSNLVSGNYFKSIRILPAWGRLLTEADSRPGAAPVAVLGYQFWQTHWAADPRVVGHMMRVNNTPVQIVGIAPFNYGGFSFRTALWLPATIRPLLIAGSPPLQTDYSHATEMLFVRLKPGVTQAAAEAELTSVARQLNDRQPGLFPKNIRIRIHPAQPTLREVGSRLAGPAIFIVMVFLVLLSACANLGNMLLARGVARQREIGIRMSVGASRMRVVRQLMTENCLLALLGAAAGLAFGAMASRALMMAMGAPPDIQISMRWPIVMAGFILTFVSAVMFGLPAALQTARTDHIRKHLRKTLVAVQVAVSSLLLIASGVLAHNGILSLSTHVAFDYENMAVVHPQLSIRNLPAAAIGQKLDALSTRLGALPGVDGVTTSVAPPLAGFNMVENLPGLPRVYRDAVASSYFRVMNLAVRRGRTFLPEERNAVIVSESTARTVWPNEDALGKIWNFAGAARTVVGVVKDSGANLIADPASIEAYTPIEVVDAGRAGLIFHSRSDPAPLIRMIVAAAAGVDETVSVSLMRASRENLLQAQEKMITLIGSVGIVATVLAAVGMFALVAFAVAQRRRELGIRIAIGARPRHILSILLIENVKPMAIGAIAGAGLAVILSRLVRSVVFLVNRDSVDLTGFAAGLLMFAGIAALATLSPAMRALRIDPSSTLREE